MKARQDYKYQPYTLVSRIAMPWVHRNKLLIWTGLATEHNGTKRPYPRENQGVELRVWTAVWV